MENQTIARTWKALSGYGQFHGYHAFCARMGWDQSAKSQIVAMGILDRYFNPYRKLYRLMLEHWDGSGGWTGAYRRACQTD